MKGQIIKVLKEVEGGRTVKAACREYGIAEATYYTWKRKYGGMEVADLKRLKELENEERPYVALGDLTPFEYRGVHQAQENI